MALAALYGAGSGALHAVTGPDHVFSLGPAALSQPQRSFSIGLRWGLGHGVGTLLLAVPLLVMSRFFELEVLATYGNRLSALALIAMGTWSLLALRKRARSPEGVDARNPLYIGFVHGIGGAGSLLLVLPLLVSGSLDKTLLFLLAFGVGSTLAMGGLTSLLGRVGSKLNPATTSRAQRGLSAVSVALGTMWLVA